MSHNRTTAAIAAVAIAAILIAALTAPLAAQGIRQQFEHVIAKALTVTGASTLAGGATIANGATVAGGATVTGGADMDEATIADLIATTATLDPAAVITVTQNLTITPGASFQPIAAEGNVSTGAITAGAAGDVLTIYNESNTTITISDTGTLKLSGNLAIAQYDSVTLISDGTNWIQIATSNN